MKGDGFLGDPLKADLIQSIRTGDLKPGERIPPFRTLANRYKVSLNTVQRVIRELIEARVLNATQGRGTFVASATSLSGAADFAVGVFARTSGHFYGDIFSCLKEALSRHGAAVVVCDLEAEPMRYVRQLRLRELIHGEPGALIVDGMSGSNPYHGDLLLFEELRRHAKRIRDPVVINRWEHPERPDATYILFDYEDAGFQVGRYLHGLGHRNIAFHSFGRPLARGAYEEDVFRGLERFNQEARGALRIDLLGPENKDDGPGVQRMREAFARADRPTAVLVAADFLAEAWFRHLPAMGLRIPQDVSVVGFFDTPWSTDLPVPLTSVHLNIEKLALAAVNHIVGQRDAREVARENVKIGAALVLRESCVPLKA
ncbi:MAG: LacI family transcriptional regulator [Planctomycetota bacterium]